MADSAGRILGCRTGDRVLLRVEGRATAHLCPGLRWFVEYNLDEGAATLAVDLRACTYFDSTMIGTLLHLQQRLHQHGGTEFLLLDPSPDCVRILHQTRGELLFHVAPADALPPEADWHVLPGEPDCHGMFAFQRNIVEAHQALAAVPGPVGDCFRPVAEFATREFEKHHGGQ